MTPRSTIDALNDLATTCTEGERGFRGCAEQVQRQDLRQLFTWRADECRYSADELRGLIDKLDNQFHLSASAPYRATRGWVDDKSCLVGSSDLELLDECDRGESHALQRYRRVLDEALPDAVRPVVERQFDANKRNHAQIRTLRERARITA